MHRHSRRASIPSCRRRVVIGAAAAVVVVVVVVVVVDFSVLLFFFVLSHHADGVRQLASFAVCTETPSLRRRELYETKIFEWARSLKVDVVVVIQGERHARRFVEMWMGQSLQNAWCGWCAMLQGARLRRLRTTRFMAIRRLRKLSRTLRSLIDNVIEERHQRQLIARVRTRWINACLWKVCDAPSIGGIQLGETQAD